MMILQARLAREEGGRVAAPTRVEDLSDPITMYYDNTRMEYVVLGQLSLDLVLRDLSFPHIEPGTQLELPCLSTT